MARTDLMRGAGRLAFLTARLTDFDRSYLAAFYKAPRDRNAAMQRDAIRSAMEKDEHDGGNLESPAQ